MHLCQCAGESVVSPQKKVRVYIFTFNLVLVLTLKFFMCSGIKMREKEISVKLKAYNGETYVN